jgi:hypothetical protein
MAGDWAEGATLGAPGWAVAEGVVFDDWATAARVEVAAGDWAATARETKMPLAKTAAGSISVARIIRFFINGLSCRRPDTLADVRPVYAV